MKIEIMKSAQMRAAVDSYLKTVRGINCYHLTGWETVIRNTYGHTGYYLVASRSGIPAGILPLFHLKNLIFGNHLISIPFFDVAGVFAWHPDSEQALLAEAVRLGKRLGASSVEIRQPGTLDSLETDVISIAGHDPVPVERQAHKVRLFLELPASSDELMNSFKAKLRSQIRRPMKDGLYARIGRNELLEDFYEVFTRNMRDLGSPVHSISLMRNVLDAFPSKAKIIMIYMEKQPVACSMVAGFRDTLENPWASSLREYSRFSPNMLLYWTMLDYACNAGYRYFNFGRSTPGEGTYRFKKQWGAKDVPLYWYRLYLKGRPDGSAGLSGKSGFDRAIEYWKRLPVPLTRVLGPVIRKRISL